MDKASAHGAGDCSFESYKDQALLKAGLVSAVGMRYQGARREHPNPPDLPNLPGLVGGDQMRISGTFTMDELRGLIMLTQK